MDCASYNQAHVCLGVRTSVRYLCPSCVTPSSSASLFGRFMDDIRKALPVILVCGGGLAFLLGLGFLVFLKMCAGCVALVLHTRSCPRVAATCHP
jgi:hypothetical protein